MRWKRVMPGVVKKGLKMRAVLQRAVMTEVVMKKAVMMDPLSLCAWRCLRRGFDSSLLPGG